MPQARTPHAASWLHFNLLHLCMSFMQGWQNICQMGTGTVTLFLILHSFVQRKPHCICWKTQHSPCYAWQSTISRVKNIDLALHLSAFPSWSVLQATQLCQTLKISAVAPIRPPALAAVEVAILTVYSYLEYRLPCGIPSGSCTQQVITPNTARLLSDYIETSRLTSTCAPFTPLQAPFYVHSLVPLV